jgi:hypothetical protein
MSWWASINFHSLAEWVTLIAVWLIFPAAVVGVLTLPSLMRDELTKAFAGKLKKTASHAQASDHGNDEGPTGEQSMTGK